MLIIIGFSLLGKYSFASEFNFAVTTVIPENQVDKDKTYFDIQLEPNEEQNLEVTLRNDTEKKVKIGISLNSATTNSNGVVEYGKNNLTKDPSLDINIEDYTSYPESITLMPKSTQTVKFHIKMPNNKFDGIVAGGITFKEIEKEEDSSNDESQGLSIKNEYSYVVAVLMRQTTNKVDPNLNLVHVKPGQINARNVILANIQNDKKTYINQAHITTKITKKNSEKIIYQENKDNLQIAPNTNFSFPTALDGEALKPGIYHLSMDIYANEDKNGEFLNKNSDKKLRYNNYWKLEKDFRIDNKVAKELNKKDVTLRKDNTWIYILIGIILLLLAILLIIWIIWRRKKYEEKDKDIY